MCEFNNIVSSELPTSNSFYKEGHWILRKPSLSSSVSQFVIVAELQVEFKSHRSMIVFFLYIPSFARRASASWVLLKKHGPWERTIKWYFCSERKQELSLNLKKNGNNLNPSYLSDQKSLIRVFKSKKYMKNRCL